MDLFDVQRKGTNENETRKIYVLRQTNGDTVYSTVQQDSMWPRGNLSRELDAAI